MTILKCIVWTIAVALDLSHAITRLIAKARGENDEEPNQELEGPMEG